MPAPLPTAIRSIAETPLAVVDLETTGLSPNTAAILEVAVMRLDPGAPPVVALDTLVNPEAPVRGTRIHGIVDDEVIGAPTFGEVAALVREALAGAVVLAYNAAFDLAFLQMYGASAGLTGLPYICLMWMRPHLGLGRRCSLEEACEAHGVTLSGAHTARGDALAEAGLWGVYRERLIQDGLRTFGDLQQHAGWTKYAQSLLQPLPAPPVPMPVSPRPRLQPRVPSPKYVASTVAAARYRHALLAYLADGVLTDIEMDALTRIAEKLRVEQEERDEIHREVLDAGPRLPGSEVELAPSARAWLEERLVGRDLGVRMPGETSVTTLPPPFPGQGSHRE
jgi:DNA polymerase III epsilon subunit-like protein